MIGSIFRISSLRAIRGMCLTIPTARTSQWIIRQISLTLLTSRTSCRRCIHPAPYSTHSWERSFRTGRRPQSWLQTIAENYKLPYYTISPTYSVCKNHGYLAGEHFVCPECGEAAEVYSRITGYYRPVKNWNDGKTQEYKNRRVYDVNSSVLHKESSKAKTEAACSSVQEASRIPQ